MITLQTHCKVALFRHQLLDPRIYRMIARAPYIDSLSSRILGLSLASKTCESLSCELIHRPLCEVSCAFVVQGVSSLVRMQSNELPVNFDGVVQLCPNSNSSVRVRGALTGTWHQGGHIDTALEIRNPCSDLRCHGASVTVGDEHIRSFVIRQCRDGRRILGESRRWIGTNPRTWQVDGFPHDASLVQLRGDVAPTPRATPRAVHEDVRRRSHSAIFLDQGSDYQTLECLDGEAF